MPLSERDSVAPVEENVLGVVSGSSEVCKEGHIVRSGLALVKFTAGTDGTKQRWRRQMVFLARDQVTPDDKRAPLFLLFAGVAADEQLPYTMLNAAEVLQCRFKEISTSSDTQPGFALVGTLIGQKEEVTMHIHPLEDEDEKEEHRGHSIVPSWLETINAASMQMKARLQAIDCSHSKRSHTSCGAVCIGQLLPVPSLPRPVPASSTTSERLEGAHGAVEVCCTLTVSGTCSPPQLWIGLKDGRVQLYDAASCMLIGEFRAHDSAVEGLVLVHDQHSQSSSDAGEKKTGARRRGRPTVWSFSSVPLSAPASSSHESSATPPSPPARSPSTSSPFPQPSAPRPSSTSSTSTGTTALCSLHAWSISPVAPLPHLFVRWSQDVQQSGGGRGGGGGGSLQETGRGTPQSSLRRTRPLLSAYGPVIWIGLGDCVSAWEVGGERSVPRLRASEQRQGGPATVRGEYRSGGLRLESVCAVSERECWVGSRHAIRVWRWDGRGGLECVRQLSLGAKAMCVVQSEAGGASARRADGEERNGAAGSHRAEEGRRRSVVAVVTYDERIAAVSADTGDLMFRVTAWEEEEGEERACAIESCDGEVFVVSSRGGVGVLDLAKQRVDLGAAAARGALQLLAEQVVACAVRVPAARGSASKTRLFVLTQSLTCLAVFDWGCRKPTARDQDESVRARRAQGDDDVGARSGRASAKGSSIGHASGLQMSSTTGGEARFLDAQSVRARMSPGLRRERTRGEAAAAREVQDRERAQDVFCLGESAEALEAAAAPQGGVGGVAEGEGGRGRDAHLGGGREASPSREGDGVKKAMVGRWHFEGESEEDADEEGEGGGAEVERSEGAAKESGGAASEMEDVGSSQGAGRWQEIWYLARMGKETQERVEWRRLERESEREVSHPTKAPLSEGDAPTRFESPAGRWDGPVSVVSSWLSSRAGMLEGECGRCWVLEKTGGLSDAGGDGTAWMEAAGWAERDAKGKSGDVLTVDVGGLVGTVAGGGGMDGGVCLGMSMGGLLIARKNGVHVVGKDAVGALGGGERRAMQDRSGSEEEEEEGNEVWTAQTVALDTEDVLFPLGKEAGGMHHVRGGLQVAVLACGLQHCAMVMEGGELYTWGNPAGGVLGLGEGGGLSMELQHSPTRVRGFGGRGVVDVACGHTHTLASAGGKAFVWGSGLVTSSVSALCGGGGVVWVPGVLEGTAWGGEECGGGGLVAGVGAGANFGCILTALGEVVTFGRNRHGALGHGHVKDDGAPRRVEALWRRGVRARQVRCGRYFLAAVTDRSEVYVWGTTGYPGFSDSSPISVPLPSAVRPLTVACSADHLLVVCGRDGDRDTATPVDWQQQSTGGSQAVLWKGGCELQLAQVLAEQRLLLQSALILLSHAVRAQEVIALSSSASGGVHAAATCPPQGLSAKVSHVIDALEWGLEDLCGGVEWMQRVLVQSQCRWDERSMAALVAKATRAVADMVRGGRELSDCLTQVERRAREEREGDEGEFVLLRVDESAMRADKNALRGTGVGWASKAVREMRERGLIGREGEHLTTWPVVVWVRGIVENVKRQGVALRTLKMRTSTCSASAAEQPRQGELRAAVDGWSEVESQAEWAAGMCSMDAIRFLQSEADSGSALLRWVDSSGVSHGGKNEGVWRIRTPLQLGGKGRKGPANSKARASHGGAQGQGMVACSKCDGLIPDSEHRTDGGGVAVVCKGCATKDVLLKSGLDMVVGRKGVGVLGGGEEGVGIVLTSQSLTVVQGRGGEEGGWRQVVPLQAVWLTFQGGSGARAAAGGGRSDPQRVESSPEQNGATRAVVHVWIWSPECRLQLLAPSERAGREWIAAILFQIQARLVMLQRIDLVTHAEKKSGDTEETREGADGRHGLQVEGLGDVRARRLLYEYEDGTVFEGGWKDGVREGYGCESRPAGEDGGMRLVFAGWFSNGLMHGKGRSFEQGGLFSGEHRGGQREGHGVLRYESGEEYRGGWKQGKRHGDVGRWVGPKGDRYEGGWKEDVFWGWGLLAQSDGSLYDGPWERGMRQGWGGREVDIGGHIFYGGWKEGRRQGLGAKLYDGMAFVGFWSEGREDGPGIVFLSNGDRLEGEWGVGQEKRDSSQSNEDGARSVAVHNGFYVPREDREGGDVWLFLLTEREPKAGGLAYAGGAAFGAVGGSSRKEREWKAQVARAMAQVAEEAAAGMQAPPGRSAREVLGLEEGAGRGDGWIAGAALQKAVGKVREALETEDGKLGRMVLRFGELVDVEVETVLWAMGTGGSGEGDATGGWQRGRGREGGHGQNDGDGEWWRGAWVVREVLSFLRHVEGEVRALCEGSAGWGEREWEQPGRVVREAVLEGVVAPLQRLVGAWSAAEDATLSAMFSAVGSLLLGEMGDEVVSCPRCGHVVPHGRSAVISSCSACRCHLMGVSRADYVVPRSGRTGRGGGEGGSHAARMDGLMTVESEEPSEHPYRLAVETIRRLPSLSTAHVKLLCVSAMFTAITSAVAASLDKSPSEVYIEPDDLIPITCLVLTEARVPGLVGEMRLCWELVEEGDRMGEQACALAHLQGCVSVLLRAAADVR